MALFIDGRLVSAVAFDKPSSPFRPTLAYPAFIRRSHDMGMHPESYMDGMLDEIIIWKTALTAEQVPLCTLVASRAYSWLSIQATRASSHRRR